MLVNAPAVSEYPAAIFNHEPKLLASLYLTLMYGVVAVLGTAIYIPYEPAPVAGY